MREEQTPTVLYEQRGHVAYVTLNRPDALNALNDKTHLELHDIWEQVEANEEVWVVVLSGAGERAFSVGQDLKEHAQRLREGVHRPLTFGSRGRPGAPRLTDRFTMSKPLIAKVRGYALGGGFELALACDIVIAATDAVFALPEARLGLVPGAGGVFRLAKQMPLKAAMGYLLTGRRMDALTAFGFGLVNEVVAPADLDDCVNRWVDELLACAPLSLRSIKEAAIKSSSMSLEQAFETRFAWEERRLCGSDALEGALAFDEKRPPAWTGR